MARGHLGSRAATESVAAFGHLLLQRGAWGERHLIPADWVTLATSLQMPKDGGHRPSDDTTPPGDWTRGYGLHFWRSKYGYRGDGAYGQFCIVLPDHDAVVVMTALTNEMQEQLRLVWTHLVPALAARPSPERDSEVAARLRGLAIPTPLNDAVGSDDSFVRADSRSHPDFGPAAPKLHRVDLHVDARDVVTLELHLEDRTHLLPVGIGQWLPGEWPASAPVPFSSAGGWDSGVFIAHLRMIQTPHILVLTLDPSTSSFTATWTELWVGHGNDPADYAPPTR